MEVDGVDEDDDVAADDVDSSALKGSVLEYEKEVDEVSTECSEAEGWRREVLLVLLLSASSGWVGLLFV